jgi:hypothetical protein
MNQKSDSGGIENARSCPGFRPSYVSPDVNLSTVKPGQEVEFTLAPTPGKKGDYTVTGLKPKG